MRKQSVLKKSVVRIYRGMQGKKDNSVLKLKSFPFVFRIFSGEIYFFTTEVTEEHRVSLPPHPVNHPLNLLLVGFHHLPQAVLTFGFDFIDNSALDFKGRKGDNYMFVFYFCFCTYTFEKVSILSIEVLWVYISMNKNLLMQKAIQFFYGN